MLVLWYDVRLLRHSRFHVSSTSTGSEQLQGIRQRTTNRAERRLPLKRLAENSNLIRSNLTIIRTTDAPPISFFKDLQGRVIGVEPVGVGLLFHLASVCSDSHTERARPYEFLEGYCVCNIVHTGFLCQHRGAAVAMGEKWTRQEIWRYQFMLCPRNSYDFTFTLTCKPASVQVD